MSDYKPVEPVTFATDMILAIQGLVFGSMLKFNKNIKRIYHP